MIVAVAPSPSPTPTCGATYKVVYIHGKAYDVYTDCADHKEKPRPRATPSPSPT